METKQIATFNIQDLLPIGLTIVVLGIGLGYGLNVLGDIKDDFGDNACPSGYHYNATGDNCYGDGWTNSSNSTQPTGDEWVATNNTILGVSKLPAKLPLIVTVIVAAVIIGLLVRYLMVRYR